MKLIGGNIPFKMDGETVPARIGVDFAPAFSSKKPKSQNDRPWLFILNLRSGIRLEIR